MNNRQLVIFISTCVLLTVLCVRVDADFRKQLEQFKCVANQTYANRGIEIITGIMDLGKGRDNVCLFTKLHNEVDCKPEMKECCARAVKLICCLDGYGKDDVQDPTDTTNHCPTNMDLLDYLTKAFKGLTIKCAKWAALLDLRTKALACNEFGNPENYFAREINEECNQDEISKIGITLCKIMGSKVKGDSSGGITVSGLLSLKAVMICLVNLVIHS